MDEPKQAVAANAVFREEFSSSWALPAASGMLVQPSQTATVCEVDRARKRAASRKRAQTSDTGQPLETYHPETTHLTAACSCESLLQRPPPFTRVAARTLARSPIRDQRLHRRLQPFCYLRGCSGCFRLEQFARVGLAPTGKRRLGTAHTSSGRC